MHYSGGQEADQEVQKAYKQAMKPAGVPNAEDGPAPQFKLLQCDNMAVRNNEDSASPGSWSPINTVKHKIISLAAQWSGGLPDKVYNLQLLSAPQTDPSASEAVLLGETTQ